MVGVAAIAADHTEERTLRLSVSLRPVSYTHLDVYKRQGAGADPTDGGAMTRHHTFRWLQDYRPGMDAEHLLRTYGIPVGSRCIPSKSCPGAEAGFDVPKRQAVWAEYLLCRAGWRLVTPRLDEGNQAALERAHSEGASRPVGGGRIRRQGFMAKLYSITVSYTHLDVYKRQTLVTQALRHESRLCVPLRQKRRTNAGRR